MIFFRLAAKILTYVQASARRPQALSATCAEARPGNVRTPPARRSGAAAKPFCNPLVFRRLQKALQKTANRSPICRLSACERPSFATRFAVFAKRRAAACMARRRGARRKDAKCQGGTGTGLFATRVNPNRRLPFFVSQISAILRLFVMKQNVKIPFCAEKKEYLSVKHFDNSINFPNFAN